MNTQLPSIVIQIAIIVNAIINCSNFVLEYGISPREIQSPQSTTTLQVHSR
jgi:hypothetical protein